jgi:hypothetical protein
MKPARLAGVLFATFLVVSLGASSAALAQPEFRPTGQTFTATTGATKLTADAGEDIVDCSAGSTTTGTISGSTIASGFEIDFTGCKSSKNEGTTFCTVKSVGAGEGDINTLTLQGLLGLALQPAGTGAGVGLLLLPGSGKTFLTLEKNSCTVESSVTGSVAGEVTPVGTAQKTGKLTLATSAGKQKISIIDVCAGLIKPALSAFSSTATEEAEASITFSATTEVT